MGWPLSGFETCPGICLAVLGDSNINKRSLEFALWFSSHIATQKFHPFVLIKFKDYFSNDNFWKSFFGGQELKFVVIAMNRTKWMWRKLYFMTIFRPVLPFTLLFEFSISFYLFLSFNTKQKVLYKILVHDWIRSGDIRCCKQLSFDLNLVFLFLTYFYNVPSPASFSLISSLFTIFTPN